ncbi:MAG TPA: glucosamine-6-phosphate deaminase [Acholeplasmataceae bacterium]|nr:glucosamine-6-phosphate deaminase [Acholeplasmataceae bacterium]
MKVLIFDTKEALFENLSQYYASEIRNNPKINLGLATGSTPVPLYEKLILDHKNNQTSYKNVKTFNLDEYLGLENDHDQSYRYFMNETFFKHIDINLKNTHIPSGIADNLELEAKRYDKLVSDHKIDIQLLGIGTNAHIGFNEPGSNFDSKTIIVDLAQETLDANVRFFDNMDLVPKKAITMGIGSIMQANKIILVATGINKAEAIRNTIKGFITKDVPASILQAHDNVVVYLDKEAASLL